MRAIFFKQCWVITSLLFVFSLAISQAEAATGGKIAIPAVQVRVPTVQRATTINQPTIVNQQAVVAKTQGVKVVAAQVVWVKGLVKAISSDKKSRVLQRKDFIYELDTITTQDGGTGQVVFSDNTLVSLSENTVVKISQYRYNKNLPQQQKYVVDVVKGGFRTVTGLISKAGPNNYKLITPVATIGVRGTEIIGHIDVGGKGSFAVPQGAADFTNEAGTSALDQANRFAKILSKNAPVVYTPQPDAILGSIPVIQPVKPSTELIQKSEKTSIVAGTQTQTGTTNGTTSTTSSTSGGSETSTTTESTSGSSSGGDSGGGGSSGGDSSTGSSSDGGSTGGNDSSSDSDTTGVTGSSSSSGDTTQGVTNSFTVCP
jgi:hypothetical protein